MPRQFIPEDYCISCGSRLRAFPYAKCEHCREVQKEYYRRKQEAKYAFRSPEQIKKARAEAMAAGRKRAAEQRREVLESQGLKKCPRCSVPFSIYDGTYYCPDCMEWARERKRKKNG